ncbi:MAG TPA: transglutaminaseTgpA domain-containing protein [Phycisphaeraceae bacterium]
MSLIYQFRRLAFAQVLLGIVAFCIAERNPGMMLVAGAVAALAWYVTEGPSGRPLPRWLINLGSLACVAWLGVDLYLQHGQLLLAMGHFTMWLQILLLYSEKSNREYAQLLVLSLMLMIGASVMGISVLYGVLLAVYCVMALLTVLLFQFKGTADLVLETNRAAAPPGTLVQRPEPVVGRGYRWQLRAAAGLIGVICAAIAVVVFVAVPRLPEPMGRITTNNAQVAPRRTGFSEQVQVGSGAPTQTNREPVLNLKVWLQEQDLGRDGVSWLLRGAVLDYYDPMDRTWLRSSAVAREDHSIRLDESDQSLTLLEDTHPGPLIQAQVVMRQNTHGVLFTHYPLAQLSSDQLSMVNLNRIDHQLSLANGVAGILIYNLSWPLGEPGMPGPDLEAISAAQMASRFQGGFWFRRGYRRRSRVLDAEDYARGWPVQTQRVAQYAQQILSDKGLTRDPEVINDPKDRQIAQALAEHLRQHYRYTLQTPPTPPSEDPVVNFLFHRREGHCELFASGLAALARSIGMRARLVTGYRASEYNHFGGYYVVRESNAHAWVEIDCGPEEGWQVFDPTPPEQVAATISRERGWLMWIRDLYEHLEFAWISSVVTFDAQTRQAVIQDLQGSLTAAIDRSRHRWFDSVIDFFRDLAQLGQMDRVGYTMAGVVIVFIGLGLGYLARLLVVRRRRLAALQLTALPRATRRVLARQLRFYLDMLDVLERYGYVRPVWQSPFSFAQELAGAKPQTFSPVVALTEIFYEVRFGHRLLDRDRRQQVRGYLRQLEQALLGVRRGKED